MKFTYFLLLLLVGLACSKPDETTPTNEPPANALVGTWRLTTYCKPTSASACTSVTVPADKNVFILFTNDGEFNEYYENTKPVEYSFLGCFGGNYRIESDNVRIVAACMSSLSGKVMPFQLVKSDHLILNPFGTGDYVFIKTR